MGAAENQQIARRLEETAALLAGQGANPLRIEAYRGGAATLRRLREPTSSLLVREGLAGLRALPGVCESLARPVREMILPGRPRWTAFAGRPTPSWVATIAGLGEKRTAPRRFNPAGVAWLPVLRAHRGARHDNDHHLRAGARPRPARRARPGGRDPDPSGALT